MTWLFTRNFRKLHFYSQFLYICYFCWLFILSDLSFHVPMDVISGGQVQSTGVTTTVRGSPGMFNFMLIKNQSINLSVGLSRTPTRMFQLSRSVIHVFSSEALSRPASLLRVSTYVPLGRPLPLWPCVGSHRITLLAGSSGWRIQWPDRVIL